MLVTVSTEAELTNQAQIYDPAANRWTPTAIHRDGGLVTTLLADGRVLLTGTQCDRDGPQIYDPQTDVVSSAGVMAVQNAAGYRTTLLTTGEVLFAGGYGGPRDVDTQPHNFVQLYNPATNTWRLAAPMLTQRTDPQSLLLADGRVFVTGGYGSGSPGSLPFLTSAEIYDPRTNAWSPAGEISTNGYGSAALAALIHGMVLAAGGGADGVPTATAQLLDPNGSWLKTGSMVYARSGASAFTLADGNVLVVGGQGTSGAALTSAERFDLATGKWDVMPGSLTTASLDQSAILLKDGRVFVTTWPDFIYGHWSTADVQIFDPKVVGVSTSPSPSPSPATWSSVPDFAAPFGNFSPYGGSFVSTATATTLTNGRVLVIGTGPNNTRAGLSTATNGLVAAIYDPANGQSHMAASPRTITATGFTATLLRSGKVLVMGGGAELYDPATDAWSPAVAPAVQRFGHTATLLADGRVLVAAGLSGPDANGGVVSQASAEIYDPDKPNSWSWAASLPLTLGEDGNTATLLRDGDVLLVSGYNTTAALYNPKSNRWSVVPSLSEPGQIPHTATLLPSGKVLILGGCAQRPALGCGRFATPEIFDPATNSWSQAAPMLHGREAFSATLLRNGQVLVAGGVGRSSVVASSELYDAVANRWVAAGDLKVARAGPAATLLRSGAVLLVGGSFLDNLRSAELYAPPPGPQPSGSGAAPVGLNVPLAGGAAALAFVVIILLAMRFRTRRTRISSR